MSHPFPIDASDDFSLVEVDACQHHRSASVPPQDAATELTAADAQRIAEIARAVGPLSEAMTQTGSASDVYIYPSIRCAVTAQTATR